MNKEILESQNQTVAEEAIDRHNELSEKELESVAGGSGNGGRSPIQELLADAGNVEIFEDSTSQTADAQTAPTQEGEVFVESGQIVMNDSTDDTNNSAEALLREAAEQEAEEGLEIAGDGTDTEGNKENVPPDNQQNVPPDNQQ